MPSLQSVLNRPLTGYVLLAILCLPLFFINVRDSHDWGDDFAGYIHQAENIVNGIPQSETGFVYNEDYHVVSVVPDIGFPLLLAPVYVLCGNDIRAFLLFISLTLFLLALALMIYFNQTFSPLISGFLCLIIVYNPWVLDLKGEILSDIPFTLILILSVIFFQTKGIDKPIHSITLGVMVGYLISIRTVGLAFPLALLCIFIKNLIQAKDTNTRKNLIKNNLIVAACLTGVYFLLNRFLFPIPSFASYLVPEQLSWAGIGSAILTNLNTYSDSIYTIFRSLGRHEILVNTVRLLAIVSLPIGIIFKYRQKMDLADYFVLIYVATILTFGGIHRYLFPILPFLFYYMAFGLQSIKLKVKQHSNLVASALGCFVLLTYYPEVKWIIHHQNEVQKGPQEAASIEAFDFIKKNTQEHSVIVFVRPRALSLYTGRTGMCNEPTNDLKKLRDKFNRMGAGYLLIHTEETREPTLKKFVLEYANEVSLEWSNEKFSLYKI